MKRRPTQTRSIIPNLGDDKAVVREFRNKYGNTTKIDVLYGGETGGDSRGHGHLVAEKIDGLFQVTYDREPDKLGGCHRIEKLHRTDAYNDQSRLDRVRKKKEIIAQVRCVRPSDRDCVEKLNALDKAFFAVGSCGHADNETLKSEFKLEKDRIFRERNAIRQRERDERERKLRDARQRRETIVGRAENLANAADPFAAKKEMRALMDQWRAAPRATREDEERLWSRSSAAKSRLNDRADQMAAQRQAERAQKQREYEQRKAEREQRQREWRERTQQRLSAKQQSLSNIESAIHRTQSCLSDALNKPPISPTNPHRYEIADRRNQRISSLNAKLASMQMRRSELIRQIADLQSKLR